MINHARATGGLYRKDAVKTVHPVVRLHPVTGEKCLFMNAEFVSRIEGLKEPEFRSLQDFLMQHMIAGHDFQARVSWNPRSIVIFDNRMIVSRRATSFDLLPWPRSQFLYMVTEYSSTFISCESSKFSKSDQIVHI